MKIVKLLFCFIFIFCFKISSQERLHITVTDQSGNKISYENKVLLNSYFSAEVLEHYLRNYKGSININIRDNYDRTPLILAAMNGCKKSVEVLLKNKADVNIADKVGKTALMHALENGRFNIAKKLLEYNDVDLSKKDSQGNDISYYVKICERKIQGSCSNLVAVINLMRNQIKTNNDKQHNDLGGFGLGCNIL